MIIKSVKKMNNIQNNQLGGYQLIDSKDKVYSVPLDEENTQYKEIQQWVADGNTIEEAD